jgi:alcohol dehydrogenase class IV
VARLCAAMSIAPLSGFGLTEEEIPDVVAQAKKASSMKGNPVVLTDHEIAAILHRSL